MKKIIYFISFILLSLFSYGQNGGIINFNSVIVIDYVGRNSTDHVYEVTNLQPCEVTTTYFILTTNKIVDVVVGGNSTYRIYVPYVDPLLDVHVKARAKSFCPQRSPDQGWVETDNQSNIILPIKFKSLTTKKIDVSTIRVIFDVEEDSNIKYYNIKLSFNSKTWKTYKVLLPNGLKGNKKYQVDIKNTSINN